MVDRARGSKGDLAGWRQGIAALCPGNVNLLFVLSVGFATALLPFIAAVTSVIYHLHAETSRGKTTVLNAGLTVWPRVGSGPLNWNATNNGLLAEIARSNNILFGLDELKKDPKAELAQLIYDLANGIERGRATKEGESAERQVWRTLVLSTGEIKTAEALAAAKEKKRGGQGVRMIDITALRTFGVLDVLHGHDTSDAFIRRLERQIEENAGSAGPAFVLELLKLGDVRDRLEEEIKEHAAALQARVGVVEGDPATAEVRRVLRGFAIIAVAGEWATEFGITGWTPGEAAAAVQDIALRAALPFATEKPSEQSKAVEATREALSSGADRFLDLSHEKDPADGREERLGYQDAEYFHVLPKALEAMHGGRAAEATARRLKDAGFLDPGGEHNCLMYRLSLPKWVNEKRVRRSILDA
jgi:putative DNA primase/helicase